MISLVLSSILLASTSFGMPAPAAPSGAGVVPSDWTQKHCTDQYLNDAAAQPALRWNAAAADHAWTSVELAWNQEPPPSGDVNLNFSAYVSNYFNSKDRMACENLADNPCDDTVLCSDVNVPAGFLILNSFVALHTIHKAWYDALGTALGLMQSHISTFQSTFAPSIPDDEAIIKEIIDIFSTVVGVGSAFVWNVIAKEQKWFTDDNYRGFSKDSVNGIIGLSINSAKDNLPSSSSDIQGRLSDALGTFVGLWENEEVAYMPQNFQGSAASLTALSGMMKAGMALTAAVPDIGTLNNEVQHLLYAKMVPVAWNLAPGKFMPFILKTSDPCSSTAQGDVKGIMDDNTAAQVHVCYDGFIFYVVTPTWNDPRGGIVSNLKLNALPGGTWNEMQNPNWAGLALDDFVISSWEAYKLNGMKNGYTTPSDGSGLGTDITFENGVQTPGFAQLPLCELAEAKANMAKHNYDSRYPGFPCNQN